MTEKSRFLASLGMTPSRHLGISASRHLGRAAEQPSSRGARRRFFASLGMTAVLLLGACNKPPTQQAPPVPVKLAPATKITAPLTIEANGVVEPLQTVTVAAQV